MCCGEEVQLAYMYNACYTGFLSRNDSALKVAGMDRMMLVFYE